MTDDAAGPDGEAWFAGFAATPVTHRVRNTGNREIHKVAVELLSASNAGPRGSAFGQMPGYATNIHNDRLRTLRAVLESSDYRERAHATDYVVMSLSNGRVASVSGNRTRKHRCHTRLRLPA